MTLSNIPKKRVGPSISVCPAASLSKLNVALRCNASSQLDLRAVTELEQSEAVSKSHCDFVDSRVRSTKSWRHALQALFSQGERLEGLGHPMAADRYQRRRQVDPLQHSVKAP